MEVNPTDSKQVAVNPTDVNQDTAGQDSVNNPATSSEGKNSDSNTIPYGVYKKLKDDFSDFKSKFSAMENKQSKAREAQMKEDGQLKELLAEKESALEKAIVKAQEWDVYKQTKKESLLNELPEQDREIYTNLSLENLDKHVQKVAGIKGNSLNVDKSLPDRKTTADHGCYNSWAELAMKNP